MAINYLTAVGVVGTFLVLILAGSALQDSGFVASLFQGSFVTGGMTITSVDEVNVLINNQPNPNGYFRITGVANRGAESIFGSVSPSQFKAETGVETDNSFNIQLSGLSETARYQVDNRDTGTNYRLNAYFGDCTGADWGAPGNQCTLANLCVKKEYKMIEADLDLPSIKSEADVRVTAGAKTDTVSVSNDQPSASFTNMDGSVQWVGGLSTGNQPPSANDYVATFNRQIQKWNIVRKTNYQRNNYIRERSEIETYLTNNCEEWFGDTNKIRNKVDMFNTVYDSYAAADTSIGEGFQWMGNRRSENDRPDLDYSLPIATMNPELVFTVSALDVGVKVDVGKPLIQSANAQTFSSGDGQGTVDVTVTNVGTGASSMSASIESCSKFSQVYSITGQQFAAGQTKTIIIPIKSKGAAVQTTDTCTVKVCDQSGFGECDTKSVTITMTEARFCTEGKKIIDGDCIKECVNNEYTVVDCCEAGEVFGKDVLGNVICEQGAAGLGLPQVDIGQLLSMLAIAAVIALIIAALLVALPLILPIAGLAVVGKVVRSKFLWVVIGLTIVILIVFFVPVAGMAAMIF